MSIEGMEWREGFCAHVEKTTSMGLDFVCVAYKQFYSTAVVQQYHWRWYYDSTSTTLYVSHTNSGYSSTVARQYYRNRYDAAHIWTMEDFCIHSIIHLPTITKLLPHNDMVVLLTMNVKFCERDKN